MRSRAKEKHLAPEGKPLLGEIGENSLWQGFSGKTLRLKPDRLESVALYHSHSLSKPLLACRQANEEHRNSAINEMVPLHPR